MKFTSSNNEARVAYKMVGKRDSIPFVLLHGFCEDHSIWAPVNPFLSKSAVIWIDLPGFGASVLPAEARIKAYAEAVLAVLDEEQISQCVLIGHSMGGYTALEFAANWPERLAGLGLVHSHPFEDNEERKMSRRRGIEMLQAGKRDLYVTQLFPNLFPPNYAAQYPKVLDELIATGKKQSPEGISAGLNAMIHRKNHEGTLSRLKGCPVLFLLGQLDTLVLPEQGIRAAMLPELVELQLLSGVAHMAMYEQPEETAQILNSFWDFCKSSFAPKF